MRKKIATPSESPPTLRQRATRADIAAMPPEEVQRLVHELQVHQTELEMQNEELRQANAKLAQSRDRLNDLYDFAPVGCVTLDQEGIIVEANLTVATLLAVERDGLIGRKFTQFVDRSAQDVFYLHQRAALSCEGKHDCDLLLCRKSGGAFFARMESRSAGVPGTPGLRCHSAIIDITQRKQTEEAILRSHAELEQRVKARTAELQQSERTARAVVDALPAHIAIVDADSRILSVNARWRKFAKENSAALMKVGEGANYLAVCDGVPESESPEAAAVAAGIRAVLVGKSPGFATEYPCHSPAEERWFIVRATPFPGEGPHRAVISHENITARVKAERATRESEARMRMSARAANIGLWDWNLITNEVHFSAEWKSQLGYAEGEIVNRLAEWSSRIHPEDIERVLERIHAYIASPRGRYEAEFRLRHKDGSYRWINAQGDVFRGAEGKIMRLMGCHIDISERKQAEEALRASEEKYRQLIHALPAAVYTCDAEGRITLYNAEAVRLWGREPKRADRWSCARRLFTPDGMRVAIARSPIALAVSEDEPIRDAELIVERADGSRSHVLAFPDPIHDSSGAVIGAVTMLVDITALNVTENALRTSLRKLRTLSRAVEQSPASVIITSPSGEIDYVNPMFTEVTGYSLEESLGKTPRLLKSGEQPREFYKQVWDTITAGRDWRGEFRNRKKNGELFWCFAVIAPIKDEHGVVTHYVEILEDITERKRLEKEVLEISAREQRRIGQDLHDDLCQWLTGSEFLASALAKDLAIRCPGDEARALKIADAIHQANVRARSLAHGLAPAAIESAGLVGALCALASTTSDMFRIRCSYDGPEAVGARDSAAALHLYRIAQEAITNAVRHGHAREIHIVLQPEEDRVTMSIRDDGSGIPQPQPQISGMGLRTMRYRAGIIGGTLEIRPGSSGGTEIVCTFPKEL